MGGIKKALTRKIGPLPAWAWAGLAAVALYLYRKSQGNAAATTNPAGTLGYYGPYGQDPYGASSGGGAPGDTSGAGVGGGTGSVGGGGGSPGGSGTDPGQPTTPDQPPTTPVTPATTPNAVQPAARAAKPKAQHTPRSFTNKRAIAQAGARRENVSGKKTKANPRSTATFSGGPVSSRNRRHATPPRPPRTTRTTNPRRITPVSTNRRRPAR